MNSRVIYLTKGMQVNSQVERKEFETLVMDFDFELPEDYMDFIRENNGAEGFIGESSYLQLWKIEDIPQYNLNYKTNEYAPGYLIFASDGGGTAYAFKKSDAKIASFQFVGMLIEEDAVILGDNFNDFLEYLYAVDKIS